MGRIAVAEFLPPEALARLEAWRQEHHDVLDRIPDDEITFDIGRAHGGTFARVNVEGHHAAKFD